jgi:tetratricopeptide (TPR) repeat protein
LLLLAGAFVTWATIVLTASRGGILSSFGVVAALVAGFVAAHGESSTGKRSKFLRLVRQISISLPLAALMIFAVALIGRERVAQRFEEIPFELTGAQGEGFLRRDVWRAGVQMIGLHPLFGVGFGGFSTAVSQHIEISGAIVPEAAHNEYLDLADGGGIFAVFCGIWFVGRFLILLGKRLRQPPRERFSRAARHGAIAALAGAGVLSLFDYSMQNAGNWLFLSALFCVALAGNSAKDEIEIEKQIITSQSARFRLLPVAALGILSVFCLWFGLAKLEYRLVRSGMEGFFAPPRILNVPFDADYHTAQAFIHEREGDFAAALEDFRRAIRRRPKDYQLWLAAGRLAEQSDQPSEAEKNYRKSIQLAPFYAEPHLELGNFLVRGGRAEEGFAELRQAVRRRSAYFDEVFDTAYRTTGGDAAKALSFLSPLEASSIDRAAEILSTKNEFSALVLLACGAENLSETKRHELVQKLFEKKRFREADSIFRRACRPDQNRSSPALLDGGFENGTMEKNLGFGWRTGELPDAVSIAFDDEIKRQGTRSLLVNFEGNYDPALVLFSQTLLV